MSSQKEVESPRQLVERLKNQADEGPAATTIKSSYPNPILAIAERTTKAEGSKPLPQEDVAADVPHRAKVTSEKFDRLPPEAQATFIVLESTHTGLTLGSQKTPSSTSIEVFRYNKTTKKVEYIGTLRHSGEFKPKKTKDGPTKASAQESSTEEKVKTLSKKAQKDFR